MGKPRYVGRRREIEAVVSHIQSGPPYQPYLVTGPGGAGKTTLLRMTEVMLEAAHSTVYIDCKNCFDHLDSFTSLLSATLGVATDTRQIRASGALHGNMVLLVDSFEMMGAYQAGLIEQLSGLARKIPVIIASRTVPDQDLSLLELPPFDSDTVDEYLVSAGLPPGLADDACKFSGGNPLLLSLFTLAAAAKNPAEISRASIESDFVSFIVSEVTGDDVFELLETASVVHSFTIGLLEYMLNSKVDQDSFQRLISLSFVTRDRESWQIHEVVGKSIRSSLKQYASKRYYELKQRALEYYDLEEKKDLPPGNDHRLQRVYMCEDDFARDMFINSGHEDIHISPAKEPELAHIPDFWQGCMVSLGFPAEQLANGYADTIRLTKHAAEHIRILRDRNENMLGYHATVPICASTIGYFLNSPATREYMMSLPPTELACLQKTSAQNTDTYFIRHLNPSDFFNPLIRAALLHDLSLCCIRDGIRSVTTIPLPFYQSLVEGLGFRQVPDVYDTTLDLPWPVYELDFRLTSTKLWYQWLAMGPTLPHWLHIILTYSKQYWREQVELLLSNLHNPQYLKHHPIAPLAEEAAPGSAEEPALKRMLLDLIGSMPEDTRAMGELLQVTYGQKTTREEAAGLLNLPPTTYYRRLKKARGALADRMFQIAVETAEDRYARLEPKKMA